MKYIYLIFFSFLFTIGLAQPISVSTTQYTPEQLVRDILINNPCANVSNVTWSTGTNYNIANGTGIGYFQNTNPEFDMSSGVILSTGNANLAVGPKTSTFATQSIGNSTWLDDDQLTNYLNGILPITTYHNATILEFDFVPYTDAISFNFIFASEEYGTYQCGYSDSFAFFLTNTVTNVTTNLALVPGTADPISVTTIRDGQYNNGNNGVCADGNPASMNVEYFGNYNGGSTTSATNFMGETVKMVAASQVTPFNTYHIKLVIQDRLDSGMDSGVFLEEGSFEIGSPTLGDPHLIDDGNGLCVGEDFILESGLDPDQFTFEWFKDGELIPGANGPNLEVTETGDYEVVATILSGTCSQSASVRIEFYEYVDVESYLNIETCPTGADVTSVDLRDAINPGNANTIQYQFYLTEEDATNDVNAISHFYDIDNDITDPLTIWVRAYLPNNKCANIDSFQLILSDCALYLNNLNNLIICEGEAVQTFDLTVQTPIVYWNAQGYTVTYHLTEQDAIDNVSPIPNNQLAAYNGTHDQRIWVRVTQDSNVFSYGVTSFYLLRYDLPVVNTNIPPLSACGVNGVGTFNLQLAYNMIVEDPANLEVNFYPTTAMAEDGNVAFALPLTYTGPAGTVYARVSNSNTGCYVVVPLTLALVNAPVTYDLAPLVYCDPTNDGFGTFNIEPTKFLVAGNPIPAGVVISYHETLSDAQNNFNKILNLNTYNNIVVNQQTIYVRVGYENSSCYSIEELQLKVNSTPVVNPVRSLRKCDVGNNNVEIFNLRELEPLLMANATGYTFTYYTSQANAIAGTSPITNPTSYSNAVGNTVYVRVTNNATGCYTVVSVTLMLDPMPIVANPLPTLFKCDVNGDGFEVFDLASVIPSIVGAQQGLTVTFHYTNANAQAGTLPLPLNYQNASPNVQTIYVRVLNATTGCYVVSTMDLRVKANPVLNIPAEPYVICSSSGFGTINLTNYGQALVNATGALLFFEFYETQANALNEVQPIPTPNAYNNLNPNNPIVWIRVEDPQSECFSVYPIEFQVVVPPSLPQSLPDLVVCDVLGNTQDGLSTFNLTQQDAALIAAQNGAAGTFLIRYYTSEAFATQNINWIGAPTTYQNTANPQEIWVRIENTSKPGSCYRIMKFNLRVNLPTVINQPTPIVKCDDSLPNDGTSVFDLTIRELDILPTQTVNTTVSYYVTLLHAQNGISEITNPTSYQNISNPQTIHVVVTNEFGCKSFTTLTIRVLPLPDINTAPVVLEECEDPELGAGTARFNLHDAEAGLSNFGNYDYEYFATEDAANANVDNTEIATPNDYVSPSGIIYVRVTTNPSNEAEECAIVVPIELKVNPKPLIGPMTPFLVCEDPFDGRATFNLHDKDAEALAGADPAEHTVKYYRNQADAEADVNAVSYIFAIEIPDAQTLFVRVENNETGCFSIAELLLKVEHKVYAFPPSSSEFCETDYDNDGTTTVNLTVMDADIVGDQVVTVLAVRYYRQDGTPINDPTNAVVNQGEVLIAEVYNTDAEMLCTATIEIIISLKDAPVVLPLKDGIICYEYRESGELISGHYLETGLPSTGYVFEWFKNGTPITADDADVLDGGSRIYVKLPGTYTVRVTGANGCTTTRSAVVQQAPSITIDEIVLTESFGDTNAIEVIAYAGAAVVLEYKLDEGPWQDSNIFLNVTPGEHTVYVRAKNALSCAMSKVIQVMDYPKFFTPNGDGYNDTWNIWSLKNQPNSKIYIFDRFGKLIKQISPAGEGWDGSFNGKPLPSTDYWFKAEYIDPKTGLQKEVNGHFSLKR